MHKSLLENAKFYSIAFQKLNNECKNESSTNTDYEKNNTSSSNVF